MPRSISYSVVGSTQEVALRLGREGAPQGTLVTAETQLLGRGREGRAWVSPKGGFYASMVVRPHSEAFPLLSLASGYELRERIAPLASQGAVWVKWPNDLLLLPREGAETAPPRKIAGVLTDVVVRPGIDAFAVVGVGINVEGRRSDFPPELQASVAFLRDVADRMPSPKELEHLVREALTHAVHRVGTKSGRDALPTLLRPHLWGVGRSFPVPGGRATFEGINEDGEALLQPEGGGPKRTMRAGELSLEAA